jgi:hypothetical protein
MVNAWWLVGEGQKNNLGYLQFFEERFSEILRRRRKTQLERILLCSF